jgi:hypothetical protein
MITMRPDSNILKRPDKGKSRVIDPRILYKGLRAVAVQGTQISPCSLPATFKMFAVSGAYPNPAGGLFHRPN